MASRAVDPSIQVPAPAPTATISADQPLSHAVADVPELLPAGRCAFDPYLSEPCEGSPTAHYALLLPSSGDAEAAEIALRKGRTLRLAAGYPFAVTFDDMPTKKSKQRGIAVVAGLFAERGQAEAYASHLPPGTEIVELASREDVDFTGKRTASVEIAEDTLAWAPEDIDVVEATLDEELAKKWVKLPEQKARRDRALAGIKPRCSLTQGRVFATDQSKLFKYQRNYAPVRCDDGREAWVALRATRLDTVVTRPAGGALVHQVILVECDQPTVETRHFDAGSAAKPVRLAMGGPC
ncbi:hypothetical protein [Polyangium sp. 6x1]|uniref:hypothetical protein n=1 Tax=Polyangium sp. 6x1 TaxID=3042689 RepID=UPI00248309F2|nr:hypothetical protein [Polyangium sp. 6x1]MDI1444336.1 hypothetical protein [Polyangium sp. 6x1]